MADSFNLGDFLVDDVWVDSYTGISSGQTTPATPAAISRQASFAPDINHNLDASISAPRDSGRTSALPPPKISSRFSADVARTLKAWFTKNRDHPYPTEEETAALQTRTGLNKTQIMNWMANARRRTKSWAIASPRVANETTSPVDVPLRPGTPAPKPHRFISPMQRYIHSPPEDEPASADAIARAMSNKFGISPNDDNVHNLDSPSDDPWRWPYDASSASSAGTSHSGRWSDSADSNASRSRRFKKPSSRRRKRGHRNRQLIDVPVHKEIYTYQCTFCAETFKTKYDWQRHEKSLHLSVETWTCVPDGPMMLNSSSNVLECVFCGQANADDAHLETHNFAACHNRKAEERTFTRKDHLRQHLHLFHDVRFRESSMNHWKVPVLGIRSRCGFCSRALSTWEERIDHLADHFKSGSTMADWQGERGFDAHIQALVENAMPPYIIDFERGTPFPFEASVGIIASPSNAYELIKVELEHYMQNHFDKHGQLPSNHNLQLEACRVIFASETREMKDSTHVSWLHDVIMSSDDIVNQARFGPLRSREESLIVSLKIIGKDDLFQQCPLEFQLSSFMSSRSMLGIDTSDTDLQEEACKIITGLEKTSITPSDMFANFLMKLVHSGTEWLTAFKQRSYIQQNSYSADFPRSSFSNMNLINFDSPDLNPQVLPQAPNAEAFPQQALQASAYPFASSTPVDQPSLQQPFPFSPQHKIEPQTQQPPALAIAPEQNPNFAFTSPLRPELYFLDGADHHRRWVQELTRWAKATMSPNNPNCHVPSDKEIQHQARWIIYEDGDPFNQTAADNESWLARFKARAGITPQDGDEALVEI